MILAFSVKQHLIRCMQSMTKPVTKPMKKELAIAVAAIGQQQNHGGEFPLVYQSDASSASLQQHLDWIKTNKPSLLEALARHGSILFRDFPVRTDLEFDEFIGSFALKGFTYAESLSNAVRRNRTPRVFTANEAPPSVEIYLHHEMAQTPVYPSRLFFFCEQAAESGGATPLCRSDVLLKKLGNQLPDFVAACKAKGVRYSNTMPEQEDLASGQGRSWHSTLNAETKEAAEARLKALGYEWLWLEEDSLRVTTPVLPAIRELDDGRQVFFNQLIAAFRGWQDRRNQAQKSISFGDGSTIPIEAMKRVIAIGEELTFDLQWQTGDIALVDNFLVMHGRRPYAGERRVLASLVA